MCVWHMLLFCSLHYKEQRGVALGQFLLELFAAAERKEIVASIPSAHFQIREVITGKDLFYPAIMIIFSTDFRFFSQHKLLCFLDMQTFR